MSTIVTRAGKGSALTWIEADANFTNLNTDKVEYTSLAADNGSSLVGYLPAGAGAFATDVQSKMRESVSVLDFHVGGSDHTAAFIIAGALAGQEVEIPYLSTGYNLTGTIPVYCRFTGKGKPVINLTVNGSVGDRGFWMKSGSSLSNVRIDREVIAAGISGEFNNAIMIGEYYSPTGTDYTDITVSNVDLVGVDTAGGPSRTTIMSVMGNCHDIVLQDINVTGYASYGMMMHWGGEFDPLLPHTSPVTKSWHPRRIRIDGFRSSAPAPDTALGAIFISACHDITVSGFTAANISDPITISAGDVGGVVAQGDSKGAVYQNIRFENTLVSNYAGTGVIVSGPSGLRAVTRWIAVDENSSVVFDGLTIERGALSSASRCFDARMVKNLEINGLNLRHIDGLYTDIYTPGMYIQSCSNVKVSGETKLPVPFELIGSKNIYMNTSDTCLRTDYTTSCVGIQIRGLTGTDTLQNAVALNDTTITLTTVSTDLIAGSTIAIGSGVMTLTKSVISGTTPAVLSITPSTATALAGASATVSKLMDNIDLRGDSEGFHTGIYAINTSSGVVTNLNVTRRFYRSGLYDIHCRAAKNVSINNCAFVDGGQLGGSTSNVRTVDSCTDVEINGCSFEDNSSGTTQVQYNIYLFSNTSGAIISNNRFFDNTTGSIYALQTTVAGMLPQMANNWFGSSVTASVLPTAIVKVATIGEQQIGYSANIPTYGTWLSGDVVYNQAPVAAGKVGWVCTVGGVPGTWKAFGVIDS